MNELKNVELFGVGLWNGHHFKMEDLNHMASAYSKFSAALRIPLKFGHNDEQAMTDGQPALGWVHNVRVENEMLLGDFSDMPDIVYKAIKQKLYDSLSIELSLDVEYKGKEYPFVLTGVALLGADLPSVNTIKDLAQYIDDKDGKGFRASNTLSFSNKPKVEDNSMNELEKALAEVSTLKTQFSALQSAQDDLVSKNTKLASENAELKADVESRKQDEAKAKFTSAKKEVVDNLELLVRGNIITPGQRDAFSAMIKDGDLDSVNSVKFTAETLSSGVDMDKLKEQSKMSASDKSTTTESGEPVDKVLFKKISELRATQPDLNFSQAKSVVFNANPKLADEYKNLTSEV